MLRFGVVAAAGVFAVVASAAETPPPTGPTPAAPVAPLAPPPFEADLLRFAEVLGALSWLDPLCGSSDAGVWRGQMMGLIDAQGLNPDDRRRYVDAFNRGYRTFASVHRSCTPRTRAVLQRYFADGAAISDRLDERFGRNTGGVAGQTR